MLFRRGLTRRSCCYPCGRARLFSGRRSNARSPTDELRMTGETLRTRSAGPICRIRTRIMFPKKTNCSDFRCPGAGRAASVGVPVLRTRTHCMPRLCFELTRQLSRSTILHVTAASAQSVIGGPRLDPEASVRPNLAEMAAGRTLKSKFAPLTCLVSTPNATRDGTICSAPRAVLFRSFSGEFEAGKC